MQALRYLNTILTILALLLTLNLWTAWSGAPSGAADAHAQGIPDAGDQRVQIIDQLKLLNQKSDETTELLKSGEVRVRVIFPEQD